MYVKKIDKKINNSSYYNNNNNNNNNINKTNNNKVYTPLSERYSQSGVWHIISSYIDRVYFVTVQNV